MSTKKTSWKASLNRKWGPHLHCVICGKAVPPDRNFCDQDCQDQYAKGEKKKKKKDNMQLFFIFGVFIVFMIIMNVMR